MTDLPTPPIPGAEKADLPRSPRALVMYVQQPVSTYTAWTVDNVKAALSEHERGDFTQSAELAEACSRDDRILGCLTARCNAVKGLPFELVANEEAKDQGKAEEVRDQLKAVWSQIVTKATIGQIVRDNAMLGDSVSQLVYTLEDPGGGKQWLPHVDPWAMHSVAYDEHEFSWRINAREGQVVARGGGGQWLITEPNGKRSWMAGAVRALGYLFVYRAWSWRDWARFCERHGMPIIVIHEPSFLDPDAKKAFYEKVQKMGSEAVFRLPKNAQGDAMTLEMVEARDTSWQTFEAWKKELDASIAICINGQNLTTEVQGGSLAAANVHDLVRADILQGDVEALADDLVKQVIIPWGRFNVRGWSDDLAPRPTWNTKRPDDPAVAATVKLQTVQALASAATAGFITTDEGRAELGYEGKSPGPPAPPAAPGAGKAPAAASAPAGGGGGTRKPPGGSKPQGQTKQGKPVEKQKKGTETKLSVEAPSMAGNARAQSFADAVAERALRAAERELAPMREAAIAAVRAAKGPEDAKRRLVDLYRRTKPSATLERATHGAVLLARLAGVAGHLEDES